MVKAYIALYAVLGLIIGAAYAYMCNDLTVLTVFTGMDLVAVLAIAKIAQRTAPDASAQEDCDSYHSAHNL